MGIHFIHIKSVQENQLNQDPGGGRDIERSTAKGKKEAGIMSSHLAAGNGKIELMLIG